MTLESDYAYACLVATQEISRGHNQANARLFHGRLWQNYCDEIRGQYNIDQLRNNPNLQSKVIRVVKASFEAYDQHPTGKSMSPARHQYLKKLFKTRFGLGQNKGCFYTTAELVGIFNNSTIYPDITQATARMARFINPQWQKAFGIDLISLAFEKVDQMETQRRQPKTRAEKAIDAYYQKLALKQQG